MKKPIAHDLTSSCAAQILRVQVDYLIAVRNPRPESSGFAFMGPY